jgi:hypothetical protein
VTLRSKSGNRDDVVLDGNRGRLPLQRSNFVPEIIAVSASNVTLADITIRYARDHGIHAYPLPNAPASVENFLMHNLRVYDCGQQLIKVNSNGQTPPQWVDHGILECSLVEFVDSSVMEDQGSSYYTGGLDVHGGWDWIVRWNQFRNIQREGKLMEHAVHMWNKCRGTLVENNRFENVWRAVGFGMLLTPGTLERHYPDGVADKPYFDHIGGIIRNNVIFNRADIHLETGIELMNIIGAEVYHNTIVSLATPFNSMEYRWPNTQVIVKNNLCSHVIMRRGGATAQAAANIENAPLSFFANAANGDLHLNSDAAAAIGKGVVLDAAKSGVDMDGRPHDPAPDIGAYQHTPTSIAHAERIFCRQDSKAPKVISLISWRLSVFASWH